MKNKRKYIILITILSAIAIVLLGCVLWALALTNVEIDSIFTLNFTS